MPDLYSEIRDEVAQESLFNFFRKYGKLLVIAVIFIVVAVAGNKTYKYFDNKKSLESSNRYFVAEESLAMGDKEKAIAQLEDVVQTGRGNFKYIAAFRKAELLTSQNRNDEAIKLYEFISDAKNVDSSLKDLASLFLAYKLMETNKDDKRIDAKLDEISRVGRPFRYMGLELKAQRELDKGNNKAAKEIYIGLNNDVATPDNIRSRARELSQLIN